MVSIRWNSIILLLSLLSSCYGNFSEISIVPMSAMGKRHHGDVKLADLYTLFHKETPPVSKYTLDSCEFELAKDGCKITFLPKEESCKDVMSLGKLTTFLLRTRKLRDLMSKMVPLGVFQIERFFLDKCKREVEFEAASKESFEVIREKIKVKSGKLMLNFNFSNLTKHYAITEVAFDMLGEYDLVGNTVPITLLKQRGAREADVIIKTDSIKVSQFISVFTKKKVAEDSEIPNMQRFTDVSIEKPVIRGRRDTSGSYEIVLKGHLSDLSAFDEGTIYVIAQKKINSPVTVAIIISIKQVNPGSILSSLTGKELNDIPLLKEVRTNVVVEYATNDITMVKDAMLNKLLYKYISNSNTITKGSKLKVDLPIKRIIKEKKKHFSLKHVPESIYVQVFFYGKTLSLQFPEDYRIGLSKILIVLIPQVPDEIFTNILKVRPRVIIERFDVNINTKSVDLLMSAPNEVMLGNGLIQLENAEFEIGKRTNNTEWDFTIKGSKMIDKVKLDVNVLKMGKNYMFQGKIWELSIRQLANHFGGGLNANEIFDELRFLDFVVKDVLILADFKQDFAQLRIEGMPLLFDWNSHFEGFLVDNGNEKKMAFGVVVQNVHLGDIVKKFFNQSMPQVSWMRDVTVTIVIANDDDENCTECEFVAKELEHARVRKGAYLSTELLVPDECNGESMCEMMKDKMRPGTKLQLDGEVTREGFKLRAPYTAADGVALGIGLLLEEAVFCVEVNKNETRVYIEGMLKIADPHLKFDAKIELAPTGQLELELAMIGQWIGPMKLRNLYFNDVELQMGLVPGRQINKLEFSGKLHIGGNFSEIIAYSTIGLSIMNSLENYFYADIGTISLPALLGSFNVYLAQLPDVFFRTSFPEGLIIGSTNNPSGKRIDHLGVVLEMGLVMKGLVQILDVTLPCRITVSSQRKFDLSANMSFFRLADDLITMQRSQNDMENGPLLDGVISSDEVYLKIGGYVNVLGIGSEAVMEISNEGLQFFVHGNLFKTVETNLTVNAPNYGMGWNVSKSEFYVSSCLSSSIKDVTVEARNAVAKAAEITEEAVKEAEDQLKNAVTWHTKAKSKLDKWMSKFDDKMTSVQRKSHRMDSIKKYLTASCTDRCPEQCVGGFSKKINCTMLFGEWISCPVWNECKKRLDDPFCLAQCQGKKMYLQGKGMKKKVAMEIVSDVIDNIQTILDKTQEFVAKAQRVVDLTNKASTKISEVVASGKLAIEAIDRHTKEKLISIQYIGFNTTIEKASDSCLELDVSANIGNEPSRRFSTEACLDMKFVKNIGVSIANQLFPGITNLKDKLIAAKVALLDAKNEANELDKEMKESEEDEKHVLTKIEDVDKEKDYDSDDGKLQKKDSNALNASINYIHTQIFNDLPMFILRDDDIMDSFKRRSPWAFSQQDSPFTEYVNKTEDDSESRYDTSSRSLKELKKSSNKSACTKTKDAVKVYSQISDTISYLVKKANDQKQSYQNAARLYSKRTTAIEKEIATHSQLLDLSPDDKEEAMFFVGKLKDGVGKWMKNLDKQLELQDKESIGTWRNSLTQIVAKKDINMKQFLKIIDSATEGMSKRKEILSNDDQVEERMKSAKKLINELLTDRSGTLHSKRNIVGALVENMFYIKDAMHTVRCMVE